MVMVILASILHLMPGCFSFHMSDVEDATDSQQSSSTSDSGTQGPCTSTDGQLLPSLVECGGECVNAATDWRNCGDCGNQCQVGAVCLDGECITVCPDGLVPCQEQCVNMQFDPEHCGACDKQCTGREQCNGGRCTIRLVQIGLDEAELIMEPGQQQQLTPTMTPADATSQEVIWSSGDPTVAMVDTDGKITALLPGTTMVKVSSTQTPSISAQVHIIVKVLLIDLTVEPELAMLTPGETILMGSAVMPGDASEQAVQWESSDPAVARVDNAGNVTSSTVGTVIITATVGGERGDPLLTAQSTIVVGMYQFAEHTFTTCGAAGRLGPSRQACVNRYKPATVSPVPMSKASSLATSSSSWIEDAAMFDVVDGIQLWTVPVAGVYRIQAAGARGGHTISCQSANNSGAVVAGNFRFETIERIWILVGQEGTNTDVLQYASGGGGGTFVANWEREPLLVAGGGGGHGYLDNCADAAAMGQGGNMGPGGGGNLSFPFGNGAGWSGDGKSNDLLDARSFINGGTGGLTTCYEIEGGFGGGGSPWCQNGGGGGGYSGGFGGYSWTGGGGGGSFNSGAEQNNRTGANDGPGYVTITWVAP